MPNSRTAALVGVLSALAGTVVGTVALLVGGVYHVYVIPSSAMAPTLPTGSWVVADTRARSPHVSDIVLFHSPSWSLIGGATFVKRVEGVGGDSVQCCAPQGGLMRNGRPVREPYVMAPDPAPFGPVVVPSGRLWLEGDNRDQSADSRAHLGDPDGGTVATTDVVGTVSAHGSHLRMYAYVIERAAILGVMLGCVAALLVLLLARRQTWRRAAASAMEPDSDG